MHAERNKNGRDLCSSLHFSALITPMMHGTRAFMEATSNYAKSQADAPGFRTSMINDVLCLVEFLEEVVGDNLCKESNVSHLWYTGNPKMVSDDSDLKYTKPWEWVWRVAEGRSAGEGVAKGEAYNAYAERHCKYHMFHM